VPKTKQTPSLRLVDTHRRQAVHSRTQKYRSKGDKSSGEPLIPPGDFWAELRNLQKT